MEVNLIASVVRWFFGQSRVILPVGDQIEMIVTVVFTAFTFLC
jgi:hypothetical protein